MANGKSLKDFRQGRDMDSVCLFVLFCFNHTGSCDGHRLDGPEGREMGRMLFQVKEDAILRL